MKYDKKVFEHDKSIRKHSDLINDLNIKKVDQSDLNITNLSINNINSQISTLVAYKSDTTGNSELILSRGNETTLYNRLNAIDRNGYLYNGAEENGSATYIYNANDIHGWGAIVATDLSQISEIIIKRKYSSIPSYGSVENITVRLIELSSASNLINENIIQEFNIPISKWMSLNNNQDLTLSLSNPYIVIEGKYYAVTVFAPCIVDVAQVDEKEGVSSNYIKGYYCNDNLNATYQPTHNSSGLYFRLNKSTNPVKLIKIKGEQVPEHANNIKLLTNNIDIIRKTGYFDNNGEENGEGGYINSLMVGASKGWGGIVETSLSKIVKFAIKRSIYPIKIAYSTNEITVNFYETNNPTSISGAKLIENFNISIFEWLGLNNGEEKVFTLSTPIITSPDKYYAVTVFAGETIDIQQTGFDKNTSPSFERYKSFKSGIWTSTDNNAISYDYITNPYGLYFKLYDNLESDFYLKIRGLQIPEHEESINELKSKVTNIQTMNSNIPRYNMVHELHYENPLVKKCPNFLDHWLRRDKDMYIVASGDSIFTHQFSTKLAKDGVCSVPPNCDRMAFTGILWELIKFGEPIYRRFDYGKNELVGNWNNSWMSEDNPYFSEMGQFDTYYHSGNNNTNDYNYNTDNIRLTTKITRDTCPITKFGFDDGNNNYPKRVSNTANASVTFIIPSGYKKFDFIYETNQQADDNVTVTINEGSGKVYINTSDRDFTQALDANHFVFSMKESKDESIDGYDSAIRGKRLFFEKTNIQDSITVTITKSTDTTKYLFYWGVSYWGTDIEPYACHLINSARGGSTMGAIYSNRYYRFKGVVSKPDLIIQECTLINNANQSTDTNVYLNQHSNLKDYMDTLGSEYFYIIPNAGGDKLIEPYVRYWNTAKAQILKDGGSYVDIQKTMYKMWQYLYPNEEVSWKDYFVSIMYDGVCHPNDKGLDFFKILLEPIFDLI